MPTNDIKNLLDSIIDNTDNSYKQGISIPDNSGSINARGTSNLPRTFDSGKFREKLSLYVLHDLVSAMMHDETKDLDDMIDESIIRHINDDYHGTCYGYLCQSRDRLKSPLIGDIIQEVEEKTTEVKNELETTKDDGIKSDVDINEVLNNVTDYDEFRNKLKKVVSDKVVKDVTDVITKRNDAVVFDDLDEELELKKSNDTDNGINTNESVILRVCGVIVTEAAINKKPISTEEGINKAIVEYCIDEMDYLLLKNIYNPISSRYHI